MAERKLNFDAPLLSTRRMKKEAVSVRRNIAKKLTDDDHDDDNSKTSESIPVPVLVQDMGLDQSQRPASVPFKCPLEKSIEEEEEEESEDDDVFSDARDTLSLKHSISGSNVVDATKPPMPCEDHPQSRDYMMNRFLPAAKSMTVRQQQPQYAVKRQPIHVMSRPVRQIRDIIPAEENLATPKRYESFTTPLPYYHGTDDEESEEDDDDDDEYLAKRGCGMMSPQVCFKNSLGMLSSVHGLKEKPYSSRTSNHDQVKSSKVSQLKSRFQSVKKLALDSIYKQKPSLGKKFNFGAEQFESNQSSCASMPSSPYRQTSCMSPYRSVGNSSPLHPSGFLGTRKEAEIMRANRLNKHIRNISKSQDLLYPKSTRSSQVCSTSSLMEKTLHVVNSPKTSNGQGNSSLPETISEDKPKKAILEVQEADETSLTVSSGIKKMEELEKRNTSGCDLSPLAPPPPKKPSDSWLLRNLPSRSYLYHPQKKDVEENSTSVTKWETIVKTSYMHRDHIRYSEELVAHSPKLNT
ncbi:unnamed protein product [Microthlaspi erraticum]|uniref:Uncharacterized protein n=1 Tax=Microthlaspi erraticum TaxID=1685480 RepID=A0A6D2HRU2_9BRAS|nr:unnamed protein product [Microthlaspi erraticum]